MGEVYKAKVKSAFPNKPSTRKIVPRADFAG